MGEKGRKRKQRRKAAHRKGLLKFMSGPDSKSQREKRWFQKEAHDAFMRELERLVFGR